MQELRDAIRQFAEERDWDQFHSPKNLAMALSVEAAELLEHFQWLTEVESGDLDDEKRDAVAEEIADVLIYLVRLADKLALDPVAEARRKLERNRTKYPVELVRGQAKKYSEYREDD
jgi:dCTP diphosphatase